MSVKVPSFNMSFKIFFEDVNLKKSEGTIKLVLLYLVINKSISK
jgi:hypothetical protein